MPYTILEHTADVRMQVVGVTLPELFSDAMEGMMNLLKPTIKNNDTEIQTRRITLDAADITILLVDFLNEVLTDVYIYKEIYTNVLFRDLKEQSLEAVLSGVPMQSLEEDIKAVTYHEAEIKQNRKGEWETMLIFDV